MAKANFDNVVYPQIFGSDTRPAVEVGTDEQSTKELEGQQVVFQAYSPKKGYMYAFPDFAHRKVMKQPINTRPNSPVTYIIGCQSSTDGGKTWAPDWFSLNHLSKRDAKNNPVHPTWYALGNLYARIQKLCEMGTITVGREITVYNPVFDNGKPKTVPARDEEGRIRQTADGGTMYEVVTRPQTCYELTPAQA